MKRHTLNAVLAAAIALGFAHIAPVYAQSAAEKPRSEPIYGYRMMSDAERNEYREKMRNARTSAERQALRDEHRQTMEARMKERGIEPGQRRGGGAGPGGPGYGKGEGPRGPGMAEGRGPGAGKGGGPGAQGYGKGPGGPGYGKGGGPGEGPGYRKGPGAGPGSGPTQ